MANIIKSFIVSLDNSFEYAGKSRLDKAADFCLVPVRYLCWGRNFSVIPTYHREKFSVKFEENPMERNFVKTAAAIALLIPGLILGTILKFFANFNSNLRWVLDQYEKTPKEAMEERDVKNVYLMANIKVLTDHDEPIYWGELKKRYTNDAAPQQIKPWEEVKPFELYDQSQSDLYCIFGCLPTKTKNIFSSFDGQFPQSAEFFFGSKNIEKKILILDHSIYSQIDLELNKIEEFLREYVQLEEDVVPGKKLPDLLFDIPIEIRCLRSFKSFCRVI